jgi:quercetin dioxygenase-like cupin family protein
MSTTVPQAQGLTRASIQEHDLSVPGLQVIQNRVDISPDAPVFRHKHPGEEVIYVLEGSIQYDIDGQLPIRVSVGEGLTVPADTIHAAKNVGTGNAAELATYIVEKGKPFLVAVD